MQGEASERAAARAEAARQLARHRDKLLDTSKRNRLISFPLGNVTALTFVRVVDELPDQLYARLAASGERAMRIVPLPALEGDEPWDERTPRFLEALDLARKVDPVYRDAVAVPAPQDGAEEVLARLERELRDRVRAGLGMPPAEGRRRPSPQEIARAHGIRPDYDLPEQGANALERHADDLIQTLIPRPQFERRLSGLHSRARAFVQEQGVNALHAAFGFVEWLEAPQSAVPRFAPLLLLPVELTRTLE